MKFKHGLFAGFIGGFLIACSGIAARELQQEHIAKKKVFDIEHRSISQGFQEGVNYFRKFHVANHVDCDRCPH